MAHIGAVCSGSNQFASILDSSVMLGNYLQQTTSADGIFRCIFFLGALRVNSLPPINFKWLHICNKETFGIFIDSKPLFNSDALKETGIYIYTFTDMVNMFG